MSHQETARAIFRLLGEGKNIKTAENCIFLRTFVQCSCCAAVHVGAAYVGDGGKYCLCVFGIHQKTHSLPYAWEFFDCNNAGKPLYGISV